MSTHRDYWDTFYAGRSSSAVPDEPSTFARWTHEWVEPGQPVVEFGFGNARDSLWFARQGRDVAGYDFAPTAVEQAQDRADDGALPATFSELDLNDHAATEVVAKTMAVSLTPQIMYARFLIHSLETVGRHALFGIAAEGLPPGNGRLFLEFRTGRDADAPHIFGNDHYRTYLDPSLVTDELEDRGATIAHCESGTGLAVYKSEDPHVARIVAEWR